MQDTENNQQNSNRQDYAQPAGEEEHETHTTALVILVLVTIIVIAVIFSVNREVGNLNPNTYDDEITQPENEIPDATHGAGIPVEDLESTDVDGYSDFPDGLVYTISEAETVTQNVSTELPNGDTLRSLVIKRGTQTPAPLEFGKYVEWFERNNYDIETNQEDNRYTITTEAENGDELKVEISSIDTGVRVQINRRIAGSA